MELLKTLGPFITFTILTFVKIPKLKFVTPQGFFGMLSAECAAKKSQNIVTLKKAGRRLFDEGESLHGLWHRCGYGCYAAVRWVLIVSSSYVALCWSWIVVNKNWVSHVVFGVIFSKSNLWSFLYRSEFDWGEILLLFYFLIFFEK